MNQESGPHVVIENSHHERFLTKVLNQFISEDVAYKKYDNQIKVIEGGKGTGFVEELTVYHRQLPGWQLAPLPGAESAGLISVNRLASMPGAMLRGT